MSQCYRRPSGAPGTVRAVGGGPPPITVTARRGAVAESRHAVHVAVCDAAGRLVLAAGDAHRVTTLRSCAKPFQAVPLVDGGAADAFALDDRTLAAVCASHRGEDAHVEAVRRGLAAAGLGPEALRNCPGTIDERLRQNCSGNHLGFLAASVHAGWATDGYIGADHPAQRAALAAVADAARVEAAAIPTGVDGCGVVAFALPLHVLAAMYARLPAELPRQYAVMRTHPNMVAGDGELDTEVMRAIDGAAAKSGAEGAHAVALPEQALGVAIRVEDGAKRAVAPTCLAVLGRLLGWSEPPAALAELARPRLRNAHGEVVGAIEADAAPIA
jgi:L-asparaginase